MKNQPSKISTINPLSAFCARHQISRTQLSLIAGGDANDASRTTMQRLLHDEITDADYKARLRQSLADNLPLFLFSKGLSSHAIDRELQQIFDKGEYQPMINERTILPKNIQTFFGLSDDPFSKPPRTASEVFTSPALKEIVNSLIDAIKFQGFVSVTGDIGSGKSILKAMLEEYVFERENLRLIFPETFDMSRVTPANISRAILEEFEVSHIPNDAVSRAKKVKKLLAGMYKDGVRVALGFDECHRMNDTALSSLKNFLEMNSGGFQKYLGVIMLGQTSFKTRLGEEKFREIAERVTPLQMPDFSESAAGYLAHRLRLVGGDAAQLFDAEAIDLIVRQAKTPLALGNIANSALTISKKDFNNSKVIGAAIKTKMYFANNNEPKVLTAKGKR